MLDVCSCINMPMHQYAEWCMRFSYFYLFHLHRLSIV